MFLTELPYGMSEVGIVDAFTPLRRECLDRMLVFGESHLRRILASYAAYYNQTRTHLALQKDAPLHRAVQRSGAIVAIRVHRCALRPRSMGAEGRRRKLNISGITRGRAFRRWNRR